MPIKKIDKGIYYKARKIEQSDGKETGIIRKNNIPITGYNVECSGIAPPEKIKTNGSVNRIGKPVFYLAEDIETSYKELKASENAYISVAECVINNTIQMMGFTVSARLSKLFSDATVHFFISKQLGNIRTFYVKSRKYLTSPDYKNQNYVVPLVFLDIAKNLKDISGIKYNSF